MLSNQYFDPMVRKTDPFSGAMAFVFYNLFIDSHMPICWFRPTCCHGSHGFSVMHSLLQSWILYYACLCSHGSTCKLYYEIHFSVLMYSSKLSFCGGRSGSLNNTRSFAKVAADKARSILLLSNKDDP